MLHRPAPHSRRRAPARCGRRLCCADCGRMLRYAPRGGFILCDECAGKPGRR